MSKKSASSPTTRRKFLGGAAVATAATVAAPSRRQGARPHQHALAEHLAVEGHLPRIRARLRQEGQRHDRRRPQDRGAAGGRRGAGLRPARRGLEGHARRRPRRARLSLRQADTRSRCGDRVRPSPWTPTCCWPGTNTAAARSCSPSSMRRSARTSSRSRTDRCRPSRSAGSSGRSPRSTTSRASSSAPSASRLTCSQGMGAAVNALPGGEIVSAMDRGLLDAAEFNNASSDRGARLCRRLEGLHAAELSPECRAVRDHVQQDQVRCACPKRCGRSSPMRSRRRRRTCR